MKIRNRFLLSLLLPASFFLVQCENQETDDLYSAQRCIASATSSTVDSCLEKISGNTSANAYSLRCGAAFIKQDITDSRIVDAFRRTSENEDNTVDPMTDIFAFLVFKTSADADQAVSDCSLAESNGMLGVALFSQQATRVADLLNVLPGDGSPIDPTALNTAIDNYDPLANPADAASQEEIGDSVIASYPILCGEDGAFSSEEVCTNITAAIDTGGGDPTLVGQALLDALENDD